MKFAIGRIVQAALAYALLETAKNVYPFGYPSTALLNLAVFSVLSFILMGAAAAVARIVPPNYRAGRWFVFFLVVLLPSALTVYLTYATASDFLEYYQGSELLILNYRLTPAGVRHLQKTMMVDLVITLVPVAIYFRPRFRKRSSKSSVF